MTSPLASPTPSRLDPDLIPSPVPSATASLHIDNHSSSPSEAVHSDLAAYAHLISELTTRSASYSSAPDVEALENDLKLSAEIGQALLAEQKVLQGRLAASELAKDQLLDRLAKSYKDSAQLEKVCLNNCSLTK
jgi:hypothetical protein